MKEITELQEITQNITPVEPENNIPEDNVNITEKELLNIDWISNILESKNEAKDTQNDPMDWESFYEEYIKDI